MNFKLRSRRRVDVSALVWRDSGVVPGVRFAVRRVTLGQRIALLEQARQLALKHEFLRNGDATEQIEAALAEAIVRKMYLDWGLVCVEGLAVNGMAMTPERCADCAPEELANEIVATIQAELGLTEEERKNY